MKGLYYVRDAVDLELYETVMDHLNTCEDWFQVGGASSRKVIHYGYKYNYGGGSGAATTPMPECIDNLRLYLISVLDEYVRKGVLQPYDESFNQCIINKYEPGQGIGAHIDHSDYGAIIGCFTFSPGNGSPGEMVFLREGFPTNVIQTADKSLYIMTGESRTHWQHQMAAKKTDIVNGKRTPRNVRISITFRSVKK